MADDRRGRDEQADREERRQRERDVAEELERGDEPEPPVDATDLDDLETELEAVEFPATGAEVVAAVGDRELETDDGSRAVADLIADTDAEVFDAPALVRTRVERPTVAAAMKRIAEASATLPNATLDGSRREAYETTLRELQAIDEDDDDEGVRVVGDWIVERIREREALPKSRDVRRRAAKFCRANGYEIRVDDWLGV